MNAIRYDTHTEKRWCWLYNALRVVTEREFEFLPYTHIIHIQTPSPSSWTIITAYIIYCNKSQLVILKEHIRIIRFYTIPIYLRSPPSTSLFQKLPRMSDYGCFVIKGIKKVWWWWLYVSGHQHHHRNNFFSHFIQMHFYCATYPSFSVFTITLAPISWC